MIQVEKAGAGTTLAAVTESIGNTLPGMVHAAAQKLAAAADAAEVLDARDAARLTYTTAQMAGRIAKAKGAHDTLVAAAHRAQADALDIEAAAKRRLADEYDAGQERGEVATKGKRVNVPDRNIKATAAEIGITRKEVHEARRVRNAEQAQPGVVREALDKALDEGKEPSRAVVNEAVAKALGEAKPTLGRRDPLDPVLRQVMQLREAWTKANDEARAIFLAEITESNQATGTGGEDVDRSAKRASSAVKVGATNSNSVPSSSQATEQTGAVPVIPAAPVAPIKTLSKADQIRQLRPHCQHPGTDLCGGSGRNHCHACKKLLAEGDAA